MKPNPFASRRPGITRRDFLKIGAAGLASGVLAGCQQPRRWVVLEPYVQPPEEQVAGVATWYATTCRQCPAGCGIVARIMNGRALKIEGNPEHPLNRGKLCARGHAGLQLLYNPDRLPGPVQQAERGSRSFVRWSWEQAINTLFEKLSAAGSGVAIWGDSTMSGHLYDLFGRFASAIGAPPPLVFDLYSALHGYALLANSGRELSGTVGSGKSVAVPSYDLGHADAIFSFSADVLGTWQSAVGYGVGFGDFRSQPLGERGYLVQLEPRMSCTGAKADLWLPIRPGTEAMVAQAMVRIIADKGLGPADRVARAQAVAGRIDLDQVASTTEVTVAELEHLAEVFVTAQAPLAIPGSALAGQENAAGAIAAVQALNLIAGNVGQPGGMLPAPQPPPPTVKPAISTFQEVQSLIERMRSGQVQVLLVHGANPAYDLPEKAGFLDAVGRVPFVVSFSPLVDETAVWADLIMPDRTYLESWGYEVVAPSFGRAIVSSQQPVVTPVFDARSTADVVLTVARGIPAAAQALPWADEVVFLKETITQLPSGAHLGAAPEPEVAWAHFQQHGGWWPEPAVPSTASGLSAQPIEVTVPQLQGSDQEYPYLLQLYVSGLLSDGRGASQPWLQGSPDPMTTMAWQTWVELHPAAAEKLGVEDGDVVRVTSPHGEVEAPVYLYPAIRPDTVAMPTGQGHSDCGRYARQRGSNPMRLVGTETDSTGTSLAWATLRVKITPTGKKVRMARFESRFGLTEGVEYVAPPI
jgi:anaerobic selenocysteine-containing dehydrogenase